MEFNSILFPAPESSFRYRKVENIVWIPKKRHTKDPNILEVKERKSKTFLKELNDEKQPLGNSDYIPCLYLPYADGSDKILVFFHGNAEDIGWSLGFIAAIQEELGVHVLSMEYPGYSLYIGEPNADTILKDAEIVYDYLYLEIGIPQENILVFGRSIGSGPATYLASRKDPGALILMSAYTSIRAVVRDVVGTMAQYLVAERFNNLEEIKKVKCPVLLLHGIEDKLIFKEHAIALMKNCKQAFCQLKLSERMTHNEYDMEEDIVIPIKEFLDDHHIKIMNDEMYYDFPPEFCKQPDSLKKRVNKRSLVARLLERMVETNC